MSDYPVITGGGNWSTEENYHSITQVNGKFLTCPVLDLNPGIGERQQVVQKEGGREGEGGDC